MRPPRRLITKPDEFRPKPAVVVDKERFRNDWLVRAIDGKIRPNKNSFPCFVPQDVYNALIGLADRPSMILSSWFNYYELPDLDKAINMRLATVERTDRAYSYYYWRRHKLAICPRTNALGFAVAATAMHPGSSTTQSMLDPATQIMVVRNVFHVTSIDLTTTYFGPSNYHLMTGQYYRDYFEKFGNYPHEDVT